MHLGKMDKMEFKDTSVYDVANIMAEERKIHWWAELETAAPSLGLQGLSSSRLAKVPLRSVMASKS